MDHMPLYFNNNSQNTRLMTQSEGNAVSASPSVLSRPPGTPKAYRTRAVPLSILPCDDTARHQLEAGARLSGERRLTGSPASVELPSALDEHVTRELKHDVRG
jgi:hypothetical protein